MVWQRLSLLDICLCLILQTWRIDCFCTPPYMKFSYLINDINFSLISLYFVHVQQYWYILKMIEWTEYNILKIHHIFLIWWNKSFYFYLQDMIFKILVFKMLNIVHAIIIYAMLGILMQRVLGTLQRGALIQYWTITMCCMILNLINKEMSDSELLEDLDEVDSNSTTIRGTRFELYPNLIIFFGMFTNIGTSKITKWTDNNVT